MKVAIRAPVPGGSAAGNLPFSCCRSGHASTEAMATCHGLIPLSQPNNPSPFYRARRKPEMAWRTIRQPLPDHTFHVRFCGLEQHVAGCRFLRSLGAGLFVGQMFDVYGRQVPGGAVFQEEEGQMIALRRQAGRGKSGLRRAGCWITSSGGDPKESATENKPPWPHTDWLVSVPCAW